MGLAACDIFSWTKRKTVKLSDSYQVYIRLYDANNLADGSDKFYELVELQECTSVKLPNYKYKEEIYEYGNNSKTFIIPDYSGMEDLEIELLENYTNTGHPAIRNVVDACLHKLFDQKTFAYKLTDYVPELIIRVWTNNFTSPTIEYVFKNLKLTDYTVYDLDYSSDSIAKWSLKFAFQSYIVYDYVEELYDAQQKDYIDKNNIIKKTEEEEYKSAQKKYQEAMERMYSERNAERRIRGVPTPNEDLDMAQDHLKNLENKKPKLAQLDKQQKELQELDSQKAELQKQLETAKLDVEQKSKAYWETVDTLEKLNQKVEENERYNHGNNFGFKWKYTEAVNAYNEGMKRKDAAQRDATAADMAVEKIEKQITDIESRQKAVQTEFDKKKATNTKKTKAYQEELDTARQQVERLQPAADEYDYADGGNSVRRGSANAYDAALVVENKKKNKEAAQKRLYDEIESSNKWSNGNKENNFDNFMNELKELEKPEPVENIMRDDLTYRQEYLDLPDLDSNPDMSAGQKIMKDTGLGETTRKILYDENTKTVMTDEL